MKKKDCRINIIGAGISGLTAAKVLEEKGYYPVIIESSNNVGGRVKTEIIEGYQLDVGFQVLLTEYPAAKKHLNYTDLKLQKLLPGALIYKNRVEKKIGNPISNLSFVIPTLFSSIGTLFDKIKICKLHLKLRFKSLEDIFKSHEKNTYNYLQELGFSEEIINDFFRPFFSGIFLETELETSSRMFEFVFKMFGQGHVAIPKLGMQAIPKQMAKNLTKTTFKFNSKVSAVTENEIILNDQTKIQSDYTIITADLDNLINNFKTPKQKWKSCVNLYFETEKRNISDPLIGLISKKNTVVNNLFYPSSISQKYKGVKELLSVTVIDSQKYSNTSLVEQVKKELKDICNINVGRLIKQYVITKALPDLKELQYKGECSEQQLSKSVFLAGDTLLNGSLNAAFISGEMAAIKLASIDSLNELKQKK